MEAVLTILAVAVAYLLGSVPTGYLIGRIAKGVDIRELGDRYTGAKNVYREIGPAAGVLTLVGDILKGSLATLQVSLLAIPEPAVIAVALANVFREIGPVAGVLTLVGDILKGSLAILQFNLVAIPEPAIIAVALAVVAGHVWPVFLQFRGGAGLATALGVLFVALPRESLILLLPFAVAAWVSRAGANLGPVCGLLLPVLLALSWWLGEPLPRILLPLFIGALVAARVYRDRLGWIGQKFFGA